MSLYGHKLERILQMRTQLRNENSSVRVRGGITVSSSALQCFLLLTLEVLMCAWVKGEEWEGVREGISNTRSINSIFYSSTYNSNFPLEFCKTF